MADSSETPDAARLRDAVERHPLLDALVRRHWIELIPYLSPAERRELWTILQSSAASLADLDASRASEDG
jgi:hypothetical protein